MIILLISLCVFLLLGIPIAYSLGLSGFCYFLVIHPELLPVLPGSHLPAATHVRLAGVWHFALAGAGCSLATAFADLSSKPSKSL